MNVPVLFLIFNRPDTTKVVFEAIKEVKPEKLYIAADGPRINKPGEDVLCLETRKVIENIDWNCSVKTLFRKENLGCKTAVSSAISWFFENEEEGIILEDDCLPNQSFFYYCQNLLEKYRNDERIMHIGGTNFQDGIKRGDGSYYFSKIAHVWGWATWRRAWKLYNPEFGNLKELKIPDNAFFKKKYKNHWLRTFKMVKEGQINTWDYQWVYAVWLYNGLAIIPNINLISNIGFGPNATHTISHVKYFSNLPTQNINIITEPSKLERNTEADNYYMRKTYKSFTKKLISKIVHFINNKKLY